MKKLSLLLLGLAFAGSLSAETVRYVSDKLEVPLRAGKSLQHEILRMMPVGTKVVVLATENDGYSKVRINNSEGWVLSRYLMNKPSAKTRLAALEQQLAQLEIERTRLTEKFNSVSESQKVREKQFSDMQKENLKLQQENAHIRQMASHTIDIDNENQKLKAEILKMQRELETGRQEVSRLKDSASKDWFIYGAVVAVISMLLGVFLPGMRPKPSSSW